MQRVNRWLWWGLAFGSLLLLALIAYWADTGTMPPLIKQIYHFPNGDRLGHFAIYGLIAYVFSIASNFRRAQLGPLSVLWGVLLAVGLASAEEASQLFIVSRTADSIDLLVGYAGIYASTWLPCIKTD